MKPTTKRAELRKLLDTCADLQQIRNKMTDPELARETRTRLRRQSKRKTEQLTRDLKGYHFNGPLAEVMKSFLLAPDHFQILAVLLHRQMCCEDPALEGRLILASIFDNSYDVLASVDLLQPHGPLRASRLVVVEDEEADADDVLESRFVLSEEALEGFRLEIASRAGGATAPREQPTGCTGQYANNRELLIDLRIIHNLYKQRADRIFHPERWNRLHTGSYQPGHSVTQRIENRWQRLRDRLANTENAAAYPAVRLMREYSLGEEEMVMVIHLLFRELFEGNAYADIAELLKLISCTEPELIHNRRLATAGAPLIKSEILCIEPMLEGRVLTGEAYLSDWVVNYLFGTTSDEIIRPDERIDWHVYLAKLDDSRGFFRDLDAN